VDMQRRRLIRYGALAPFLSLMLPGIGPNAYGKATARSKNQWLDELLNKPTSRDPEHPLRLGKFADHYYYLTDPIGWHAGSNDDPSLPRVDAPMGFVTDLASIPRIFWAALPPDGDYAYAAVLHDYLYWTQTESRAVSDDILKNAMQDFNIGAATLQAIYQGVRVGGESAWKDNAALRQAGEKRVLSRLPDDPLMTWKRWKQRPDVFA
jgi:hypothetical protein